MVQYNLQSQEAVIQIPMVMIIGILAPLIIKLLVVFVCFPSNRWRGPEYITQKSSSESRRLIIYDRGAPFAYPSQEDSLSENLKEMRGCEAQTAHGRLIYNAPAFTC